MPHGKVFLLGTLLAAPCPALRAGVPAADLQEALGRYSDDAQVFGGWLAEEIGSHVGFAAAGGDIGPASTLGLARFRVTLGLEANLAKLDSSTFPTLGGENGMEAPPFVPVAFPQLMFRTGLPGSARMDGAVKVGSFPRLRFGGDGGGFSAVGRVFGLTLRKEVLGGSAKPAVSLGFSFHRTSGEFSISSSSEETSLTVINGTSYSQTTSVALTQTQAWRITTWSVTARVSRKLPVFQPWLGLGWQWYLGTVDSVVSAGGDLTLDDSGGNVSTGSLTVVSTLPKKPRAADAKFLAGFWLGGAPFAWTVQFESRFKSDYAAFAGFTSGF